CFWLGVVVFLWFLLVLIVFFLAGVLFVLSVVLSGEEGVVVMFGFFGLLAGCAVVGWLLELLVWACRDAVSFA
ncbi:hypothetical protein, partial [Pseudomonas syringae group genomosp. 7]|uniref:hypothetical protein n=1 Tax=Pseudomonas syringae group genomosp. 7 TaxID=251699 RepID=UPI0037706102